MSAVWAEAVRCHREGNFAEADQLYHQVLHEAKLAEDEEAYEIACYHLARVAFDAQDNPAAVRRFKQLLEIQESKGDNRGISRTLRYLSELYLRQDDLVRALKIAEKAYDIVEGVWDREQMASSKHLLGILYQRIGDGTRAVSALREAQAIWEEILNEGALLQTTLVLADVYEDQGKLAIAIRAIKQALKLLSQEHDVEEIAELHFRLAQMSMELGDVRAALMHLLACLGRHRVLHSSLLQRDMEAVQQLRLSMNEEQFWQQVLSRLGGEGAQQLQLLLEEHFPDSRGQTTGKLVLEQEPLSVEQTPAFDISSLSDEIAEKEIAEERSIEPTIEKTNDPDIIEEHIEESIEAHIEENNSDIIDFLDETEEDLSAESQDTGQVDLVEEATSMGEELASEEYSRTQELSKYKENKKDPPPVVVNWEEEDVDRTENSLFVETKPNFVITDVTRSKIQLAEVEIKNNFYRHFLASFLGVLIALLLVQWIFA